MGIDYRAKTIVGLSVGLRAFFKEELVQACLHPEALGKRFCPECGLTESQRRASQSKDVLKSEFENFDAFKYYDGQDAEDYICDIADSREEIGGLTLISSDAYDDAFLLGREVLSTESNRSGGGYDRAAGPAVIDIINDVTSRLTALGLLQNSDQVQVFTLLDVS